MLANFSLQSRETYKILFLQKESYEMFQCSVHSTHTSLSSLFSPYRVSSKSNQIKNDEVGGTCRTPGDIIYVLYTEKHDGALSLIGTFV